MSKAFDIHRTGKSVTDVNDAARRSARYVCVCARASPNVPRLERMKLFEYMKLFRVHSSRRTNCGRNWKEPMTKKRCTPTNDDKLTYYYIFFFHPFKFMATFGANVRVCCCCCCRSNVECVLRVHQELNTNRFSVCSFFFGFRPPGFWRMVWHWRLVIAHNRKLFFLFFGLHAALVVFLFF